MSRAKEEVALKVKYLHPEARRPTRSSFGAPGLDIYAYERRVILPKALQTIDVKLKVEIPEHFFGQLTNRGTLLENDGIIVCTKTISPGIGTPIKVTLYNSSQRMFIVRKDMKIAQLIVIPRIVPVIVKTESTPKKEEVSMITHVINSEQHVVNLEK